MGREIAKAEWESLKVNMPFEGQKHQATIVELPFRKDVWRLDAKPALKAYEQVIKSIAKFEKVYVCVAPEAKEAIKDFSDIDNVEIVEVDYDDSWARDNVPVFVKSMDGETIAVDFGFNAWGGSYNGLYDSWDKDNALGEELCFKRLHYSRLALKDFILEGGSIHTNGNGTLLVTSECLLSPGRNPHLTKEQIEDNLKFALGQKKVIWLPYGVYKDETSGHVDNIACFLDETHVLLGFPENDRDSQFRRSMADLKVLESETTWDGKKIEVIKMPMPGPLFFTCEEAAGIVADNNAKPRLMGDRLAGSYVNFYMGDDFIILPTFGCPEDKKAKAILDRFYQGKKTIIQVPGREILLGGGNIHCITKQIPD